MAQEERLGDEKKPTEVINDSKKQSQGFWPSFQQSLGKGLGLALSTFVSIVLLTIFYILLGPANQDVILEIAKLIIK